MSNWIQKSATFYQNLRATWNMQFDATPGGGWFFQDSELAGAPRIYLNDLLANPITPIGVATFLTFKPGTPSANGHVATWPEVDAFANSQEVPWILYIDPSITPAEVPPGSDTDFKNLVTITVVTGGTGLTIKDGAVLRNIENIITAQIVAEAVTQAGIIFELPGGILRLREGGVIANSPGSLVPAVQIVPPGYIIVTIEGGGIFNQAAVAVVEYLSPGGFYVIAQVVSAGPSNSSISDNSLIIDVTSTLLALYDDSNRLGQQAQIAGTILYTPTAKSAFLLWDFGTTANRPSVALQIGAMYFDTDLGIPIWWNGVNFVNASGAIV